MLQNGVYEMMSTTTKGRTKMLGLFVFQVEHHENHVGSTSRVIRASVLYILVTFGNACGPREYKSSKGLCCPMCNIVQGLYIQSLCSTIKDTVCDVLDGYHCVDYSNSQCQLAQKHTVCNPGQEIKTPGTKRSDTKCEDCPSGFYSPTGLNCTRWTNCAAKNEIETETGSSIKDVTCTQSRRRYGLYIAAVPAAVTFILICMHLFLKPGITRSALKNPTPETDQKKSTHQTAEENKEDEDDFQSI